MKNAPTYPCRNGDTAEPTHVTRGATPPLGRVGGRATPIGGTVDADELFKAVPSPDTVRAEEYEAAVASLGEAGAELFTPASDYAAITVDDPGNTVRETAPAYAAEFGAGIFAAGISASAARPALVKDIDANDSLRLYLQDTARFPLLTPEEETELAKRVERGDGAAKDRMVESNTRLVVSCVFRYPRPRGALVLDLIQEGNLGLITAVEKFNWRLGYRFSTYAIWWIQRRILDALPVEHRVIRLPLHAASQIWHVRRVHAELARVMEREPTEQEIVAELTARGRPAIIERLNQKHGRPPSDSEIESALNTRRHKLTRRVRELLRASAEPLSLYAPVDADQEGDDRSLADTYLADTEESPLLASPDQLALRARENNARRALCDRIYAMVFGNGREDLRAKDYPHVIKRKDYQRVIRLRYGFTKRGELTHEETACAMGLLKRPGRPGDRVVFTRDDYIIGIRRGQRAKIIAFNRTTGAALVRLDDCNGRAVERLGPDNEVIHESRATFDDGHRVHEIEQPTREIVLDRKQIAEMVTCPDIEKVRALERQALRLLREPWLTTKLRGDLIAAGIAWRKECTKAGVSRRSCTNGDAASPARFPMSASETALRVAPSR